MVDRGYQGTETWKDGKEKCEKEKGLRGCLVDGLYKVGFEIFHQICAGRGHWATFEVGPITSGATAGEEGAGGGPPKRAAGIKSAQDRPGWMPDRGAAGDVGGGRGRGTVGVTSGSTAVLQARRKSSCSLATPQSVY